jgi:predicted nucleic acid-binding protein
MNTPRIYLESTIPSYLVARSSRDAVLRGQQEATKRWWERDRENGNWFVSAFVELEISRGDSVAARRRMDAIAGLPRLGVVENVKKLAADILASGLIPAKAELDASHIAIAAVHGMDILLTWNCTHIHNATIIRRIESICSRAGHACPVICSPLELL